MGMMMLTSIGGEDENENENVEHTEQNLPSQFLQSNYLICLKVY